MKEFLRLRLFLPVLLLVIYGTNAFIAVNAADKEEPAATEKTVDSKAAAPDKDAGDGALAGSGLSATDTSTELTGKDAEKLEELENHFFGRNYPHEPIERRVLRLERFVFGTEYSGAYPQRLTKLEESLTIVEPDGTKRTISLNKPAPVSAPAQPPSPPSPAAVPDSVTGFGGEAGAMPGSDASEAVSPTSFLQKDYKVEDQLAGNEAARVSAQGTPADQSAERPMAVPNSPSALPAKALDVPMSVPNVTPPPPRPRPIVLRVTKESFPSEGKPQQLIKELTYAIKVHPQEHSLQFERAKALIQLDKYESALADLSDAIINEPNKSEYYLARAWVYMKLGNSVLAADDIKQARFVDPALPAKIDLSPASRTQASSH